MTTATRIQLPDYGYVSRAVLDDALCYLVDNAEGARIVGQKARPGRDFSGLVFPYYWPGETLPRDARLRRHQPDLERDKHGNLREVKKYLSAPGYGGRFYFHPKTPVAWLKDTKIPVIFTEGEKKALALWRYFHERGEQVLVIGLSGVWNWRAVIEKVRDAGGHVIGEIKGAVPDFDKIIWNGRTVWLLFDANVHTNESVRAARKGLTRELQQRNAVVEWLDLPADCPSAINGVDDFLNAPAYGPAALDQILADGSDGGRESATIEQTDWGMLERLALHYPHEFVFVEAWGRWAAWNGSHWDFEHGAAQLQAAIIRTAQLTFALEGPTVLDAVAFGKYCVKYRQAMGVTAVRKLAEQDVRFRRGVEDFDRDPWLLNCANGTLDLRTGELRPPAPADLITRCLAVPYNPAATCPKWDAFLHEIFLGDRALVDFVWRALGYSLSGDTSEQVFFVAYGKGKNGKSTLLEVVRKLLGSYAKASATSAFEEQQRGGGHSDALAVLNAARLIVASESNEGVRLDEALVKQFTGERAMMVARKYESFWEMKLTGKLWLLVNHRPEIRGLDEGIWRRVVQIPFLYEVPEEKRVKKFEDVLYEAEAAGILAWMVRGLHDYLERNSLGLPKSVQEANQEYRDEMDILKPFLEARCVFGPEYSIGAGELYRAYEDFCRDSAVKPVTQNTFGRRLKDRKLGRTHTRRGVEWLGVALA